MSRGAARVPALALLRHRSFRVVLVARTTSFLGSAMAPVGLAFAVLQATGRATDLGIVLAAYSLPLVGFLLIGGVTADRVRRDRVLVWANVASAVAQAATAALSLSGQVSIAGLAVLQAVTGTGSAFLYPAYSGLLPHLMPAEHRQAGNAVLGLSRQTAVLLGAPLGALLAAVASPGWALVADSVSFAVSAGCWASLHLPPMTADRGTSVLADLRDGWADFRSRTWLWGIVVQFTLLVGLGDAAFDVLAPVVSRRQYGGPGLFGGLLGAEAAGAVAAGLVVAGWRVRRPLVAATCGILVAAATPTGLALHWPVGLLLALAACAGAGHEVFGVMWDTVMQQEIPPDRLSRLAAFDAFGSYAGLPAGMAAMGFIAGAVGVSNALLIGAGGVVLPTLAVFAIRDVRTMRLRDPDPVSAALATPAGPAKTRSGP